MDLTIARLEAIPEGEGRAFAVGSEAVAVFRTRDGQVFAVQADCPHKGGPLADGLTGGLTLICPLHSWKFDLATGAGIERDCVLRTFPTRIDVHGNIVLTVSWMVPDGKSGSRDLEQR
jgi:nitrite reductase (NADH) small subunit